MDIKEIEKYKIRDYYMIPIEVIDNIFYLFEQQIKKQKEVIDNAIKCIEKEYYSKNTTDINSIGITTNKLLQIRKMLKEVSE